MFSPDHSFVKKSLPVSLSIVVLFALGLAGCSEEKAEVKQVIRPVKVVEIAKAGETRTLQYSGSVHARTEMNLGFRVSGKITERKVNIGDQVEKGEVLARIDATDYKLALDSAKANLVAAQKQVETTDLALKRSQQLFSKDIATKSQLEQAQLTYDQASSTRDAAASSVDQALNQVSYTDLKADQNGIVTAVSADVGQVVASGTAVLSVAVDGEKEAQIAVPEMDIAQFKPGKTVQAGFWADTTLAVDGKVREVSGSADTQSRTFSVRVSLPNDPRILLGMTATITAAGGEASKFVSVPLAALGEQNGKKIVWVVDRQSETVHARDVKVADFSDDGVNVTDGLKAGDVVVAAGTQFMTENLKVKLPDGAQQAAAETTEIVR